MNIWLDRLLEDAHLVELRTRTTHGWQSRLFSQAHALAEAVSRESRTGTCYTTLNRPVVSLTRARNMALKDSDIGTICRVVFDLDPNRPTGTPSTDGELASALQVRDELVALLTGCGWPMPALGMSGNGAHAVYRASLKNTTTWRQKAAELYMGLRDRLAESCREAGVNFDTSVRNPGRIWRIYGTVNMKGTATPERPHRKAEIILPAGAWQPVRAATIQRTIDLITPVVQYQHRKFAAVRFTGAGDYATLDAVAWFQAHDHYRRDLGAGKHAVRCPWAGEHSTPSHERDTSTVLWEAHDGLWPVFHCSHAHCDGRKIQDVMALWGDADHHCARAWRADHG